MRRGVDHFLVHADCLLPIAALDVLPILEMLHAPDAGGCCGCGGVSRSGAPSKEGGKSRSIAMDRPCRSEPKTASPRKCATLEAVQQEEIKDFNNMSNILNNNESANGQGPHSFSDPRLALGIARHCAYFVGMDRLDRS